MLCTELFSIFQEVARVVNESHSDDIHPFSATSLMGYSNGVLTNQPGARCSGICLDALLYMYIADEVVRRRSVPEWCGYCRGFAGVPVRCGWSWHELSSRHQIQCVYHTGKIVYQNTFDVLQHFALMYFHKYNVLKSCYGLLGQIVN